MPFNKGDFTQQGIAGHVNSILRLNEKRYVGIDLTSNEEAEGCTIAGTVTDLLNDKVYPIGSTPSGNIEITENTAEGEPLNIAQYATATVNVAGGGSSPRAFAMINAFSLESPIPLNTAIDIREHLGIIIPTNGGFSATINVNGVSSSRHFTYDAEFNSFVADGGGFMIDFNSGELYVTLETAPTALSFSTVNAMLTGGVTMADGGDSGLIISNVKNSLLQDNTYSYIIEPNVTAEIVIPAITGTSTPK